MGNPTVTPIVENFHALGFMVSEARGHLSRDQITVLSGQTLLAGTVLGRENVGATGTAAALGTNTGNGTFGTITVGTAALTGGYTVEFDAATLYVVSDPNGSEVGHGTTGAAFSAGGLGFTITAGGTAFVAGDSFTVTVVQGTLKYGAFDPTASAGFQTAVGILAYDCNASAADKIATAVTRECEVNSSELVWGANVTTAPQKTIALASLAALNIIAR
jgi:hypothetical protein